MALHRAASVVVLALGFLSAAARAQEVPTFGPQTGFWLYLDGGLDPASTLRRGMHTGGLHLFLERWGVALRGAGSYEERAEFRSEGILGDSHPSEEWTETSLLIERAFRPGPHQMVVAGVGLARVSGADVRAIGPVEECSFWGCFERDWERAPRESSLGAVVEVSYHAVLREARWTAVGVWLGVRAGSRDSLSGLVVGSRIGGIPR